MPPIRDATAAAAATAAARAAPAAPDDARPPPPTPLIVPLDPTGIAAEPAGPTPDKLLCAMGIVVVCPPNLMFPATPTVGGNVSTIPPAVVVGTIVGKPDKPIVVPTVEGLTPITAASTSPGAATPASTDVETTGNDGTVDTAGTIWSSVTVIIAGTPDKPGTLDSAGTVDTAGAAASTDAEGIPGIAGETDETAPITAPLVGSTVDTAVGTATELTADVGTPTDTLGAPGALVVAGAEAGVVFIASVGATTGAILAVVSIDIVALPAGVWATFDPTSAFSVVSPVEGDVAGGALPGAGAAVGAGAFRPGSILAAADVAAMAGVDILITWLEEGSTLAGESAAAPGCFAGMVEDAGVST